MASSKLTWIIQDRLTDTDSTRLTEACKKRGNTVVTPNYTLTTLIGIPATEKVMFYGTIPLASDLLAQNRWKPCVVKNDNFDYEIWSKQWAPNCLNGDAKIFTIEQLQLFSWPAGKYFVRPCLDSKLFTGKLFDAAEFRELAFTISMLCPEQLTTKVALSDPKTILEEWRIFLVNKKVVTGSLYQKDGKSQQTNDIPQDMVDFCEGLSQKWSPAEVFTLDVARYDGRLQVIETGCFNHAGLYSSDAEKLVTAVCNHFEVADALGHPN